MRFHVEQGTKSQRDGDGPGLCDEMNACNISTTGRYNLIGVKPRRTMSTPDIEQRIAFGPFQMGHLQEPVDDAMRRSFYSYLAEKVIPLLQGRITRIDGRLWSHYDRPEFAEIPAVRHRFYYEVSLVSEAGSEDA